MIPKLVDIPFSKGLPFEKGQKILGGNKMIKFTKKIMGITALLLIICLVLTACSDNSSSVVNNPNFTDSQAENSVGEPASPVLDDGEPASPIPDDGEPVSPMPDAGDAIFDESDEVDTISLEEDAVLNPVKIIAVSSGFLFSLSLAKDGTIWAWGDNGTGQLGDGSKRDRQYPQRVKYLIDVIAISADYYASLALKSDGTVWAWGTGNAGAQITIPEQVNDLTDVVAISQRENRNYALKSDGTLWTWGGMWGSLHNQIRVDNPTQIEGLSDIATFSISNFNDCITVVKSDGTVWGCKVEAQKINNDSTVTIISDSFQVVGLTDIVVVSSTVIPPKVISQSFEGYGLALKSDGTIWAWGKNEYGQLGNGECNPENEFAEPVQVMNLTNVIAVLATDETSYALKSDGTLWAWGYERDAGKLGNDTDMNGENYSSVPIQFKHLTDVVAISHYHNSYLAIKKDGTVWEWGRYNYDYDRGNFINIPMQVVFYGE